MKLAETKTKEFQNNSFRPPGRKEYQILEILWDRSPLTVAGVLAVIPPERALAYTTVMTMLDQLFKKGLLQRIRKGRAFVY